jgi:regulator of sirC expression with transglutaminase-like and TPR domain
LLQGQQNDAGLLFSRGEVYRVRGKSEDSQRALQDFSQAAVLPDAPQEVHRSLAFVYRQREDKAAAIQSFERYLQLAPGATDAPLIERYLSELKS